MNRVLWRCIKLAVAVFFAYLFIVQIIGLSRRSSHQPPYPKNGQKPAVKFIDDKFHHHETDKQVVDGSSSSTSTITSNKKHNGLMPPPSKHRQHRFTNTLFQKPQQDFNFSNVPSDSIWPNEAGPNDDRIVSQMMYTLLDAPADKPRKMKKILVYTGLRDNIVEGQKSLIDQKCPVNECYLTGARNEIASADVVLWQQHIAVPPGPRPMGQIWMLFLLESPYHTPGLSGLNNLVNWTGTYRSDSTIVAPYERFTLFNSSVTQLPLTKNYAAGKTKKVAWFVSNCGARNNRLGYAHELAEHIEVDIYGACGKFSCPRSSSTNCFEMLTKTYKFYLAFENSNCRDYITEKFFVNGLQNDIIPIVMGAHPDDYRRAAPTKSYIHVDDFESPKDLANYLKELDQNDDKYNEYFRWKGTGTNINTYFWCRMCAMAHAADYTTPYVYPNLNKWWRGTSICKEVGNNYIWPKW